MAYTLVTPLHWFPVILARTTFPGLAGLYQHDPGAARLNSWQWYRLLLLIGVTAAVTVNLMAGTVLSSTGGKRRGSGHRYRLSH